MEPFPVLDKVAKSKGEWPAGVGPGVDHTEVEALTARGRDSPTETQCSGQWWRTSEGARSLRCCLVPGAWSRVLIFMRNVFKRTASPSY